VKKNYTLSQLAKELGVPQHRINYLFNARYLDPDSFAYHGAIRIYSEKDKQVIRKLLNQRKQGKKKAMSEESVKNENIIP